MLLPSAYTDIMNNLFSCYGCIERNLMIVLIILDKSCAVSKSECHLIYIDLELSFPHRDINITSLLCSWQPFFLCV